MAPNKTKLTAAGAYEIATSALYRLIVNQGDVGSTVDLADTAGSFATIATDDVAIDREYRVKIKGEVLTVTITGNPNITVTHD